ncbi:MAG: nucleotidyltransferase domain-containing protein, partial [bacterium]|nr:nucleotidyltransferase domain-containing protein [bacterium]
MPIPMSLTEVTRRLVAELKPEQIILFGSHAWGRPTEHSDVDLLVIVPHSDRRPAQRATSAYRCLRDIPFPLDVLVKTRAEVEQASRARTSLVSEILR